MEPALKKQKKPLIRRLLRGLAIVVSSCILFAALFASLLFVYKDEVTAAILKELNRHLKAEVRVLPQNIDLTLFRSFPDCSLQFKDVTILEPNSARKKDTLVFAHF